MKVLLIEDDGYMAQLYQHMFTLENFQVDMAGNGKQALDSLKDTKELPDLIMLDVMMPQMDGFQFLEERNKDEKLKSIPVIVLTNMYDEAAKSRAVSLGANEYFIKSEQDPKDLVEKIKKNIVLT